MLAFNVLVHAVKMIFHDLWASIRITFVPFLLGFGLAFGAGYLIAGQQIANMMDGGMGPPFQISPQIWFAGLVCFLIVLFAFWWAAVAWHRYGLLAERPQGIVPPMNGALIWAYCVASLKLLLAIFVMMLPAVLLFAIAGSLGQGALVAGILIAITMLLVAVMIYRISLILPAAAIGENMTIGAALEATRGYSWSFVMLAVLISLIGRVAEMVAGAGVIGLILYIGLLWFNFLLGLSVLTTLYGYLVEGRDLD